MLQIFQRMQQFLHRVVAYIEELCSLRNHFTSAVCKFMFPSLFIENIMCELVPFLNVIFKELLHILRETPVEM